MNKKLNNEHGITLPELLAVFVILAILGTVIMSVLLSGFKSQARIQIESELRDEADIIMAELISDFYTLKSSEIEAEYLPEADSDNYYIELTDGSKIGFYEGKIHLKDNQTVSLTTDNVRLDEKSKIVSVDEDKGLYHIYLTLTCTGEEDRQKLTTESEIAIIKN